MTKTALVLGATGGIGGETARALIAHGWHVRGLTRSARSGDGIGWIVGDALDRAAVMRAAEGAQAIVHAVNPAGYRDWDTLVLPMLDNSIAAALANNARLALPGTIYNFDPEATPVARPESPQAPKSHKGAIRVEMERRLAETPGLRALVLRFGDFFGPRPGNSWLSQGMVTPGKPVRSVMNPARAGHAWAYLPDAGEAFARLIDADDRLPVFAHHHFAGDWDADGRMFAKAVAHAGGQGAKVRSFPWAIVPLLGLFNATMREMVEMKPYWHHPVRLDNASLVDAIGEEPHTPLGEAVATTLRAMGCV